MNPSSVSWENFLTGAHFRAYKLDINSGNLLSHNLFNDVTTIVSGGHRSIFCESIEVSSDGDYIFTCNEVVSHTNDISVLIKTNSNFDVQWIKDIGLSATYGPNAKDALVLNDGSIIVSGYFMSSMSGGGFLVKTNSDGDFLFFVSNDSYYNFWKIEKGTPDGLIVSTNGIGYNDPEISKFNESLNLEWSKNLYD